MNRQLALVAFRGLCGVLGVGALALGTTTLAQRSDSLVAVLVWLLVGVLVHDLLLAPLTHGWSWLSRRRNWPTGWGLVWLCWGSLTLVALPVLLASSLARVDPHFAGSVNATELNAPTWIGWLVISWVACVALLAQRGKHGSHPGRG